MTNPRITKKEYGLLKGAMRRVFARSEIRKQVLEAAMVEHSDPKRKRVKKWALCNNCKKPEAKSYCVIDHISPVIPLDSSFEEQGLDRTADRMWCEKENLQVLCEKCHDVKTKEEAKLRKEFRNGQSKKRKAA